MLRNDVKHAFVYSGGSIMPVIDKLYNSEIKYTVNSHEQNSGHAATGYAKTSDKRAVVLVTSGPGITNMLTPMLDATNDSTPLVVISGQVAKEAIGTNAFQEAPAVNLSKNVTKWSYTIDNIKDIPKIIDNAFKIAYSGKNGSVHLDIPKCVSSGFIYEEDLYNEEDENNDDIYNEFLDKDTTESKIKFYVKKLKGKYNETKKENDLKIKEQTSKIIDIINKTEKPILYIGQGCKKAYKELREFAIKGNIPVTTTIHGNGIFCEDHPLSLRWCGMHGNPAANYGLQEATCIIALGSRFDDRTTGNLKYYAPKAFEAYKNDEGGIIHVNINNDEINKVVESHFNFNEDCGVFLNRILPNIEYNERKKWINKINYYKKHHNFQYRTNGCRIYMENVLKGIYEKTKDYQENVLFTTGVGNHQMQAYQHIKSHYPSRINSSGSLGVMGAGLPYAIGAQIANPEKMVICIDGDSSFNMTLTDMKTIVENNLPVKIAIMNNNAQMMVTIWEKLFFNERYAATINEKNPDFTKLAEAYGIKSLKVDKKENLNSVIEEFIDYNEGPILCEFNIEKTMCLPLVAPGKALDDMILTDNGLFNIDKDSIAPS